MVFTFNDANISIYSLNCARARKKIHKDDTQGLSGGHGKGAHRIRPPLMLLFPTMDSLPVRIRLRYLTVERKILLEYDIDRHLVALHAVRVMVQ